MKLANLLKRNSTLKEIYLGDVIEAGYQFQSRLSDYLESKQFQVSELTRNDARFPDIRATNDQLDLFLEAKSSKNAPITSMRALSYYPATSNYPHGRFAINANSIRKYGAEGVALVRWINRQEAVLKQACTLYERITDHFGYDFEVIGKDTFSRFGSREERLEQFGEKAAEYREHYSTITNEAHSIAKMKNDASSRRQAIHMDLPVGRLVNRIFETKFVHSDGDMYKIPLMVIGGSGDSLIKSIKWFGFAEPFHDKKEAIREVFNASSDATIDDSSPGRLELIMKIRFDDTKQLFDVGVLLFLD